MVVVRSCFVAVYFECFYMSLLFFAETCWHYCCRRFFVYGTAVLALWQGTGYYSWPLGFLQRSQWRGWNSWLNYIAAEYPCWFSQKINRMILLCFEMWSQSIQLSGQLLSCLTHAWILCIFKWLITAPWSKMWLVVYHTVVCYCFCLSYQKPSVLHSHVE